MKPLASRLAHGFSDWQVFIFLQNRKRFFPENAILAYMPPELIEYGEACGPPQRRDAQIFDLTIAVRPQAGLESQRLSTFLPGFVNSLRGQAAMPVPVFVRKSGVPSGLPLF